MIRVALASYGMSSEVFHAPLLSAHPHFELYKVLERNREASKERYPKVTVVKKFEDILQDEAVDLVVVNTPNAYHFSMCKEALEAGKHVVVEKPFVNTTQEGQQLINLARKKHKILTVFQNRRLDSDFLTVRKVIQGKLLGQLVEYEAHYDRYRNYVEKGTWKESTGPGSGILYNLGSHMIDQALVLFGLPVSVLGRLGKQRKGSQAFDSYHLLLSYENFEVVLKSSYLVRDPGPRYKLLGNLGTFTKYGLDPQEEDLKAGFLPGGVSWGKEPEEIWGTIDTEISGLHLKGRVESERGQYNLFYDNLYQAITRGDSLLVPAEEALQVIHTIELAILSHKEGRALPFSKP